MYNYCENILLNILAWGFIGGVSFTVIGIILNARNLKLTMFIGILCGMHVGYTNESLYDSIIKLIL